ncbi:hypothetical protein [Streptosporangium amethystogenes]|uniref:hypothetical protein n=1 Tax=Streptosporangium amethystogenes TaxID=2002 RepID=UPI003CCC0E27
MFEETQSVDAQESAERLPALEHQEAIRGQALLDNGHVTVERRYRDLFVGHAPLEVPGVAEGGLSEWWQGPNPSLFSAAFIDLVPVRGNPAPITCNTSASCCCGRGVHLSADVDRGLGVGVGPAGQPHLLT